MKQEIINLSSYQSDALHWNLEQIDKAADIALKALNAYRRISATRGVKMHSEASAQRRIQKLLEGKDVFLKLSRKLAVNAQKRESLTKQPKELLFGIKSNLTITNYLGGVYYFTCDEVKFDGNRILLVEGKHSEKSLIPSLSDIKDGLLKMVLFSNLKNVTVDGVEYDPIPVLKLTTLKNFSSESLTVSQREVIMLLKKEAEVNNLKIEINGKDLSNIRI